MKKKAIVVAFSTRPGFWEANPSGIMRWEHAVKNHNSGIGTLIQRKYDRGHNREKYTLEYQHFSEPREAPHTKLRAG